MSNKPGRKSFIPRLPARRLALLDGDDLNAHTLWAQGATYEQIAAALRVGITGAQHILMRGCCVALAQMLEASDAAPQD